jgi:CRP/FNR family transcriptional regulator, cyclic AMP receptor protein
MSKELKTILILSDNQDERTIIENVLEELHYRVITAITGQEARLKFANEKFFMLLLDMDVKGSQAKDFIDSIRRKEDAKNMKEHVPIMVLGGDASVYQREYSHFDNVKFLEKPFTAAEVKKKFLTFSGQSDVISENSREIKEGEYLITEGGTSSEMYWVLEGTFVITKLNHEGQNVIIGEVHPGELVGEMSFLDELPRSASVRAKVDSEVLVIPHKKFVDVLDHQPRWFRSLMRTLSQRLRNANKMIARKVVSADDDNKDV